MTIGIISESVISPKRSGGIHTAFLNHQALLRRKGMTLSINSLQKADVTHLHTIGPFALLKLFTSSPTVISSHLLPESFIGSYKGARLLQGIITLYLRFIYNHVDLVLALTKKTEDDLRKIGVTTAIKVLSNPVDIETFYKKSTLRVQGRKKFALSEKAFVVLGVGNVIPRKGVEEFIALAQKFPEITFLWAGGKLFANMLRSRSFKYTRALQQIPPNVRFLGHVSHKDMAFLYNAADVFVFASHQEIAPMVVLEAAACGLPLILSDLPEYRDLYKHAYLHCRTVDDFAAAVKKLQKEKTFYQQQSDASTKLAKKFSYTVIGDQLLTIYQSLLKK